MSLWIWLFGSDREQRDRREGDDAEKISPAMPMAGAGAELSGENAESETEKNLRRAAENDRRSD